ncbi:hypothetical protein BHE74_00003512 [Ensete ventricosum]|nr:hypothetical protein BHE74_00003512 [Ensete ventricosum]
MSPLDLNQVCVIHIEEGGHLPPSALANPSSSFSCPDLFRVRHDERGGYCIGHHLHQPQQELRAPLSVVQSLCNACGIRQRKARRAMAAAALNGGLIPADAPSQVQKERELDVHRNLPFKKRCKVDTAGSITATKLRFGEATLNLNRSSAIKKVFPQEDRDAAILLMALSCGLIRS